MARVPWGSTGTGCLARVCTSYLLAQLCLRVQSAVPDVQAQSHLGGGVGMLRALSVFVLESVGGIMIQQRGVCR